ncbi:MAG TPA: winged helix-turn-helix transcriptional regulator, partial [Micromonospora sp.]
VRTGPPVGVSYELTESGLALLPALDVLARWAEEHLPGDNHPDAAQRCAGVPQ